MNKEEFEEWLEEHKDEAVESMRDSNKSLILWLAVLHAQLKILAIDVAEDDDVLDDDEDEDGGISEEEEL